MPCAVLVALDMIEEGIAKGGSVLFETFEPQFDQLISRIDPSRKGSAWQPFFHLAGDASLWVIKNGESVASFADLKKGRPRSKAALISHADKAQIHQPLLDSLTTAADISAVRTAMKGRLKSEDNSFAQDLASILP